MPITFAIQLCSMLVMASYSGQEGGGHAARVMDNVTDSSFASRAFRLDEMLRTHAAAAMPPSSVS